MPGLAKIADVKVHAVCNRTQESGLAFADEFDVPVVCEDWRELVALDEIDIIWIGTWPNLHCEITLAALEAGKHVYCQARIAANLPEARKMLAASRRFPEQATAVCCSPVGMEADPTIRKIVKNQDRFGKIQHVLLREFRNGSVDPNSPLDWKFDERCNGINSLAVGIWVEVLKRWVGPASRLLSSFNIFTPERLDPATGSMHKMKIPEEIVVVGDLAGGGTFNYHWSDMFTEARYSTVDIVGTEGRLFYDATKGADGLVYAAKGDSTLEPVPIPDDRMGRWTSEADFIHAVRTGDHSRIVPDFEEASAYMAFTQAMWDSAESGGFVDVPAE